MRYNCLGSESDHRLYVAFAAKVLHDSKGLMYAYFSILDIRYAQIKPHIRDILSRFVLVGHLEVDVEIVEQMDDGLTSASETEIVQS